MAVYNKKVPKRRRKRTGSKRKITKPRNKRMNRSRQMGGAAFPALTPAEVAAVTAAREPGDDPTPPVDLSSDVEVQTALNDRLDENVRAVGPDAVTQRAQLLDQSLNIGVQNQQKLCDNIKGSIGNLIHRVKQCETTGDPIDLSELAKALNSILLNVVKLNGQCTGLGNLLKLLEKRLMAAGCLSFDTGGEFDGRLANIDRDGPPAPVAGGAPDE